MTQKKLKIKNQNIVLDSCKELGFPDIVEQIFGDEEKNAFIIEASAGTGKTYTMTYIVLELIMKGVSINKILAITFTEKAAYELKTRIRNLIQKAAQLFQTKEEKSGQEQKNKLKTISKNLNSALENFSQNQISTIHSHIVP
jgi:ATP-dependent exoDNAse (exonuclease V) beta subunit